MKTLHNKNKTNKCITFPFGCWTPDNKNNFYGNNSSSSKDVNPLSSRIKEITSKHSFL